MPPNPVSDRQIDRTILDLHMQPGYYPSFDREDVGMSHFANESMHTEEKEGQLFLPNRDVEVHEIADLSNHKDPPISLSRNLQ